MTSRSVVVGVCAGIAAYKSAHVVRGLRAAGHSVRVVPTPDAAQFVGRATWEALSGNPAPSDVYEGTVEVDHVHVGQNADLVIVAPTTANTLAKAAHGIADNLLTNVLLTARCPVILAPAMHTEMWEHAATQENVRVLRERGVHVVPPAVGRLTGADSGTGRLPEPESLVALARGFLDAPPQRLDGLRIVISAGGTREPLDPVRVLTNRSSGKQGHALAAAALARGAHVDLVTSSTSEPVPAGVVERRFETTQDLRENMHALAAGADVVIMAAAVGDFRASDVSPHKVKTGESEQVTWTFERTPDILAECVARRHAGQVIVGFAAETGDANGDVLAHAERKLARKGCDLLVANDVSGGKVFAGEDTAVTILSSAGGAHESVHGSKLAVAHQILSAAVKHHRG